MNEPGGCHRGSSVDATMHFRELALEEALGEAVLDWSAASAELMPVARSKISNQSRAEIDIADYADAQRFGCMEIWPV